MADITVYKASFHTHTFELPNASGENDNYKTWNRGFVTKNTETFSEYSQRVFWFDLTKYCFTKQEAIDHIKSMYKQTMSNLAMEVEQARLAYETMKAVLETEQKKEAEHLAAIENLEVINDE